MRFSALRGEGYPFYGHLGFIGSDYIRTQFNPKPVRPWIRRRPGMVPTWLRCAIRSLHVKAVIVHEIARGWACRRALDASSLSTSIRDSRPLVIRCGPHRARGERSPERALAAPFKGRHAGPARHSSAKLNFKGIL